MAAAESTKEKKAKVEGLLKETPLAQILMHLHHHNLSGQLVLSSDTLTTTICTVDGMLVWTPSELPPNTHHGSSVQPTPPDPSEDPRLESERLFPWFGKKTGEYAYYDQTITTGQDPRTSAVKSRIPALVVEGVRRYPLEEVEYATIARVLQRTVRLKPPEYLDETCFSPGERKLIQRLTNTVRVSGFVDGAHDPTLAKRTLYLLILMRAVEFGKSATHHHSLYPNNPQESRPSQPTTEEHATPKEAVPSEAPEQASPIPAGSSRAPNSDNKASSRAPAPKDLSPEHQDLWRDLCVRSEEIEGQHHYRRLRLSQRCTSDELKQAFHAAAKVYHPDRLPAPLSPLRNEALIVFRAIQEAYKTLKNQSSREQYDKQTLQALQSVPPNQSQAETELKAAMEIQKVEMLAKKQEWLQAFEKIQTLVQMAPRDADIRALRAELLFQAQGANDPVRAQTILEAVDEALQINSDHEKALVLRARVLQAAGKRDESLAAYVDVLSKYPKNVEAQRAERIASLRRARQSAAPKRKSESKPFWKKAPW